MIRKFFRKSSNKKQSRFDKFLEKYNLPKAYFATHRRAITRGLAIGAFWALIPMPMQMAGVMALTPFVKFNVPLAIAVVWLSNPLTYPIMFYVEYITGNFLLQQNGVDHIELTMQWFSNNWDIIASALYTGAFFYATVVNGLMYMLTNYLWIRSVHKQRNKSKSKS
jgi:uncharacterized protein (DUF2062 family)